MDCHMKQAFLIIAHNNPEILTYQLELLDSEDVAFFIHIDKRASINKSELIKHVKKAHIEFIEPKKIKWGSYSQIDCEIRLLKASVQRKYDYYHLISGVDMPLHTISEMQAFLEAHPNTEYIHFDANVVDDSVKDRIRFYHFFPGRKKWQKKLDGILVKAQRILNVDRLKNHKWIIQKGANWFSITHTLAQSVVVHEKEIRQSYVWSFCGDEVFLQTYIYNSIYKNRLDSLCFNDDYEMCLRKIDWARGNPYVFRVNDFDELAQSKCFFARKFDWNTDSEIVKKIYKMLKDKDGSRCEHFEL